MGVPGPQLGVGEEWFLEFPCGYGQAGRKKPLREFTLDRMLEETERVCEEVLEDTRTRCEPEDSAKPADGKAEAHRVADAGLQSRPGK